MLRNPAGLTSPVVDTPQWWEFTPTVTAAEVMKQIVALPPGEQAEVIRFAYRLDAERKLSGPELSALAEQMVASPDAGETARLRSEIMRGFYGGAHA